MSRWLWMFVFVVFAGGCGGGTDDGRVVVSAPGHLNFGEVAVSDTAVRTLAIRNHSDGEVRVWVEGVPRGFRLPDHPRHEIFLRPHGTTEVAVSFTPDGLGRVGGTLVLGHREQREERIEIRLDGVGVARDIAGPGELDFGVVPVGSSKTLPLHVQTATDATLHVKLDRQSGFHVDVDTLEVRAGERVAIEVTFAPLVAGGHAGGLLLKLCSECEPLVAGLRGEGGERRLQPEPSSLHFGTVFPGRKRVQTLELLNAGNLPVEVQSVGFSREADRSFRIETRLEQLVGTIGPGERKTVDVAFAPSEYASYGDKEGLLLVYGTGGELLFDVPLHGAAGGPALGVSPLELDFGVLPLGAQARQVVNLSKRGSAPVVIEEMFVTHPSGPFEFRVLGQPPHTVGEEGLAVEVLYNASTDPGGVGAHEARLIVRTNEELDEPLSIPLLGRTAELSDCEGLVAPETVRLGLVPDLGRVERRLQWANTGTGPCGVWDVDLDPEGSPAFRLEGRPVGGVALAPGGTLEMTLVFDPTDGPVEQFQSTAVVFSHSGGEAGRVDVNAYPSAHRIRVSPPAIDFGRLPIGYEKPLAAALVNIGGATVPVERIVPGSENAGFHLEVGENLPGSLDLGQRERLLLSYRNTAPGEVRGSLEIWIEGVPEPFLVPLKAEGLDEACGALCEAPVPVCPPHESIGVEREHVLEGQVFGAEEATSCHWSLVDKPYGTRSSAPTATGPCSATFTPDMVGTYIVEMWVGDGETGTSCTTELDALPVAQGMRFETFWERASDVDVHVLAPGTDPLVASNWMGERALFHGAPVVDGHPTRHWGSATAWLDRNDTTGTGPENPRIANSVPGARYAVGIHWNQAMGHGSNWVTTNVYCGGILVGTTTVVLQTEKEFIFLGDVQDNGFAGCVWRSNQQSWLTGP